MKSSGEPQALGYDWVLGDKVRDMLNIDPKEPWHTHCI